jgi:uncharacterized protein (DUF2147 family)
MLLTYAVVVAAAIGGADISGDWVTSDRSAVVRIAPCGSAMCGTVVRVVARGPGIPQTDIKNPDSTRRSRPLVGLTVLSGFHAAASGWSGGRAYDPETGRTYSARLSLNSDNTLAVTGCVLFICRSQTWRRAG